MPKLDTDLLNPYIRTALYSTLKKGSMIRRRVIYDWELIHVRSNSLLFTYGDVTDRCRQGQFVFIRPGVPHSFDCSLGDVLQPHIHFDMVYLPDSRRTPISYTDIPDMTEVERSLIREDVISGAADSPFVRFSDSEEAERIFYKVIDSHLLGDRTAAKGYLTLMIGRLMADNFPDDIRSRDIGYHSIAREICDLVDSTNGVGISLDALEKRFSYSRFYLEREFGKSFGVSIVAYALKKRMNYAKELLKDHNVSQVAQAIGFSSIYSFSRAFKNRYGVSPSEYKREESAERSD